jgi:hypothetical protein
MNDPRTYLAQHRAAVTNMFYPIGEIVKRSDIWTLLRTFNNQLSPGHHVIVASSTYFFLFTLVTDVICFFAAPLYSIGYIVAFPLCVIPALIGAVLPFFVLFWIYSDLQENKNNSQRSIARVIIRRFLMYLGMVFLLLFLFAQLIFVEGVIFPVSAIPFVTTSSALLLILCANEAMRHVNIGRKRTVIAMFVLLILSVKFIDLDTRKPFTRHLFLIHKGMSRIAVEKIMSSHLKNWVEPESAHYRHLNPQFSGVVLYRHTTEWWGNADWGKVVFNDGRVVGAEICLCD